MLSTIPQTDNSELVIKLNGLIDAYNKKADKTPVDLQLIDAMAEQTYISFRANPSSNPLSTNNKFMKWYMQKQIDKELEQFVFEKPPQYNKQKQFISLTQTLSLPTLEEWIETTTPKAGERSSPYKEIDNLLFAAQIPPPPIDLGEDFAPPAARTTTKELIENVVALQKKILHLLINLPRDKPLMQERFKSLLLQTNSYLNQLIELDPIIKAEYKIAAPIPNFIDFSSENSNEIIADFVFLLANQQNDFTQGDFQLSYLGGNNNRNWLATNAETGEHYVVRLEKADDPHTNYLLVDEVKKHSELKEHLANDIIYYPTNEVMLALNYARPFNLAISEYCPKGDILGYRNTKKDSIEILTLAVDTARQVAEMAASFQKDKKGYFDIKPENFLIREDGTVITADFKSIQRTRINQVLMNEISTTDAYAPPETRGVHPKFDANKFMSYQIGAMMYLMVINVKEEEKKLILEKLEKGELSYNYPIFQSEFGKEVKNLIESTQNSTPVLRPSPEMIAKKCQELLNLNEHPLTFSASR